MPPFYVSLVSPSAVLICLEQVLNPLLRQLIGPASLLARPLRHPVQDRFYTLSVALVRSRPIRDRTLHRETTEGTNRESHEGSLGREAHCRRGSFTGARASRQTPYSRQGHYRSSYLSISPGGGKPILQLIPLELAGETLITSTESSRCFRFRHSHGGTGCGWRRLEFRSIMNDLSP